MTSFATADETDLRNFQKGQEAISAAEASGPKVQQKKKKEPF